MCSSDLDTAAEGDIIAAAAEPAMAEEATGIDAIPLKNTHMTVWVFFGEQFLIFYKI